MQKNQQHQQKLATWYNDPGTRNTCRFSPRNSLSHGQPLASMGIEQISTISLPIYNKQHNELRNIMLIKEQRNINSTISYDFTHFLNSTTS